MNVRLQDCARLQIWRVHGSLASPVAEINIPRVIGWARNACPCPRFSTRRALYIPRPVFQLVTLEDAPRIILCPLHVVTSAHSNLVLCFATSDESGSEVRRMLCVRKTPLVPGPRPRMPLLLEIVGQIAADNCYLTVDGHPNTAAADGTAAEDDEREASCWIEARPDVVSRIYWRSVLPTIQTIAEHITGEVDMSNLVTVTPNGSVRLQVIWQPSPGETITSSLPMFNEAGEHQVPATLADVPFNVAVRVVFTLEYHYDREQDGPRTLFASLTRICRV